MVGLVGVAGIAVANVVSTSDAAALPPCTEPVTLTVIADPAIAATVQQVAHDYDVAEDSCARTEVIPQASADTAAMVASGNATDVDAWIPDSPVWLVRMASTARSLGRAVPDIALERSIASSPIVFAAPANRATELEARDISWKALLNDEFDALLPDPEASSASLSALQSLERSIEIGTPRQFQDAMIRLNNTSPASVEKAFTLLANSPSDTFAIASEHEIARHNQQNSSEPLVALYPSDGTLALNFPFLRMLNEAELAKHTGANATPIEESEDERATRVRRSYELKRLKLALWNASDTFADAGLRNGTGGGELDSGGVVTKAVPVNSVAASAQVAILRTWGILSLRSRILAVIDLSGSMEEPTITGLRRIDLVTEATTKTLSQFSGDVDLGVWAFSTTRVGERDWESLAPIASIADAEHRDRLTDTFSSLPSRLGGATGLYDTTLAAVTEMRANYDPSKVNSVLLLTDGKNEDDNGITLDSLISQLQELDDPSEPVPVVLVGVGPDTDITSMRRIANVTGGAAYSAAKPQDLSTVLTDALSQRACRPNC